MSTIIFDCDGVLFDSNALKTNAFRVVLKNSGFDEHVVNEFIEYHKRNGGVSRYIKFQYLYTDIINQPLSNSKINQLLSEFSISCVELYNKADLTPGCVDVLEILSHDHELYVASGGDQIELREVFSQRRIDGFFKSILGSPKTKSECVKSIVSNFDADIKCVMVGDSVSDWLAADKYGVGFIFMNAFSEDVITMTELASENRFAIIEDLNKLVNILK
jgi:phosphoglycolate phosphatase-like HAD superfamily hydrolase